jgi:type VI secretion system protein ImpE
MNAQESFKAGQLQDAITAQLALVKSRPADKGARLFLFELASFAGDLDRAKRQIEAVTYDDAEQDTSLTQYRLLLDSETERRKVFRDGTKPSFLADPPEHVQWRLEALCRLRQNNHAEASKLLEKANSLTPLTGLFNDRQFEGLRDADDLLGTVLEVMARGRYFWVPLEQIETLALNPPKLARDLIWLPARMEMNGSMGEIFLPTLYHDSHSHPDDAVKLGRTTDWKQQPDGPVLGVGLKTFLVGDDPYSLLEWRELQLA